MKKYFKYGLNFIKSFLFDIYYYLVENLSIRVNADSYQKYKAVRYYPDYIKYGAAVEGVKYLALKYCKGKGVDIGAGKWPLDGARGIEYSEVENAYIIKEEDESLDFVFSSHLLEHLDEPYRAIDEWYRVLKKDGIIFMYLPHPACHMWKKENLKYHIWNPDPYTLEEKFKNDDRFEIEYITYLPDGYMSFVVAFRKQ